MVYVIIWIVFALMVGAINSGRGNSFFVGFLLSVILSPLLGLIIVVCTKKNEAVLEKRMIKSGKMKKCPDCAEVVKSDAAVCKHCGYKFNETKN